MIDLSQVFFQVLGLTIFFSAVAIAVAVKDRAKKVVA
jgi:hypothetical protein